MEGTHHNIMSPEQAGICGPASGPTHLRPSLDTNLHLATTFSCVDVLRGVAPRGGGPTIASGPTHNFSCNVHSCTLPCAHTTHHPGWHQPILALHHTPRTMPPMTHHATLPHTKRAEEDSPIPAQHPIHHATLPHTKCMEKEPPIPAQHPTPPATDKWHSIHTPWT